MKAVVYSQQGEDTLSGVYTDIIIDAKTFKEAIVVKTEDGEICHFISCKNLDTIGIWQANELDKRRFISACKANRLIFMIVPDTDSDEIELQTILQDCIENMQVFYGNN